MKKAGKKKQTKKQKDESEINFWGVFQIRYFVASYSLHILSLKMLANKEKRP